MQDPGPLGRKATSPPAGEGPTPGRLPALLAVARSVLMATGLVVAYYLLPMTDRLTSGTVTALVCGLIGVTLLFAWQIRTISRSPNPRLRAVEALATTLPLLLLLFSAAYYLLDHAEPGSFNEPLTRTDALYFTLTVFSTVGFGDIAARTQTARVLTMLQMTGNLLLVGVAARIVVSAVRAGLRQRAKEP